MAVWGFVVLNLTFPDSEHEKSFNMLVCPHFLFPCVFCGFFTNCVLAFYCKPTTGTTWLQLNYNEHSPACISPATLLSGKEGVCHLVYCWGVCVLRRTTSEGGKMEPCFSPRCVSLLKQKSVSCRRCLLFMARSCNMQHLLNYTGIRKQRRGEDQTLTQQPFLCCFLYDKNQQSKCFMPVWLRFHTTDVRVVIY